MKSRDWQRFFNEQHERFDKDIFTNTELAHAAGVSLHALNVELSRLCSAGFCVRYAQGRYGLPDVPPERLLPYLDGTAYITGMAALYRHSLITQAPSVITCFTLKRHGKAIKLKTPAGVFEFRCIGRTIYHRPPDGIIAGPSQAFCDFIYLCLRKGIIPESSVTVRNRELIDLSSPADLLQRYPHTVRRKAIAMQRIRSR